MKTDKPSFQKIAFVGNYLPRRCGIATFTADLCESFAREVLDTNCVAVAMNDTPEGYSYPDRVRFEVAQNDVDQYRQLADFLNMGQVDLVCIQHEYGIFGGPAGSHLLMAVRRLRMPIVTTLHTVLKKPNEAQKQVLTELCSLSERIVVMSQRSAAFLQEIYAVPADRIELIHHGIPDMPFVDPNYYQDLFGVEGRRVMLTFGLLSPDLYHWGKHQLLLAARRGAWWDANKIGLATGRISEILNWLMTHGDGGSDHSPMI